MINGIYESPGEAMGQRLTVDAPELLAIVGTRITPNKPTQGEPYNKKPYLVFWKIGGGGEKDLTARSGLQSYNYRLEFHCETDEQTELLRRVCLNRLCGNPRQGITPWREVSKGVQGCFAVDDADADTLPDGTQVAGQTVTLWFCPQV